MTEQFNLTYCSELTGITNPDDSGPRSNGNEGEPYIP